MRRTLAITFSFAFVALALPACGGHANEPLSHKLAELDTEIAALDGMAAAHATVIEAAADLGAMSTEELAYGSNAYAQHETLHHVIEELVMCERDGQLANTFNLMATIEDIEAELSAHATAMAAATDTTGARTEETRHQAALDAHLASMSGDSVSMAALGDEFACPEHHH